MARGARQSGAVHRKPRPRVVIVDDHAVMLDHAARALADEFTVAALFRDVKSLMEQWQEVGPDAIVLDVSLLDGNGFDAARRLRASGCDAPIVFLSVYEAPEFVRAGWAAGGIAYVAKRDLSAALVPAVCAALRGRRYVSASIASP
jgi:two-component system OmpR family response regulator